MANPKTLWDIGVELVKKKAEEEAPNVEESSLLIIGNKGAGKTTMLGRFLDRDKVVATTALEYSFARRSKSHHSTGKQVAYLWELGGGTNLVKLIDVAVHAKNVQNLSVLLVLDLSRPEELWHTMETLLGALQRRVEELMKQVPAPVAKEMQRDAWERVGGDHPDKSALNPFLLPLAIVGSKYDLFLSSDSLNTEQRSCICKALRYVALTRGASLQFYSMKQEQLAPRLKSLLATMAFRAAPSASVCQVETNKPLVISPGADTLQAIGSFKSHITGYDWKSWKNGFEEMFEQKVQTTQASGEDPAKDPQYAEAKIDLLRIQKDQELEQYKKKGDRKTIDAAFN